MCPKLEDSIELGIRCSWQVPEDVHVQGFESWTDEMQGQYEEMLDTYILVS